ncbi:MAG: PIN domain nuclease [Deltaproteobacteria bacterium]|jgi:predicted nucleic acid-binding protein|nr:MAG: PIN domain nuclease [Deltaproteobacteria bacterium]
MIILADTSVWIDFFAGRDTTQTRFFKEAIRKSDDVALTELVLAEILQGIPSDAGFAKLRKVLSSFRRLRPASEETYVRAAGLYRTGRKRGVTIRSLIDCLIAAIAMEHGASVLHRDRDYERISEYSPLKTIPGKQ